MLPPVTESDERASDVTLLWSPRTANEPELIEMLESVTVIEREPSSVIEPSTASDTPSVALKVLLCERAIVPETCTLVPARCRKPFCASFSEPCERSIVPRVTESLACSMTTTLPSTPAYASTVNVTSVTELFEKPAKTNEPPATETLENGVNEKTANWSKVNEPPVTEMDDATSRNTRCDVPVKSAEPVVTTIDESLIEKAAASCTKRLPPVTCTGELTKLDDVMSEKVMLPALPARLDTSTGVLVKLDTSAPEKTAEPRVTVTDELSMVALASDEPPKSATPVSIESDVRVKAVTALSVTMKLPADTCTTESTSSTSVSLLMTNSPATPAEPSTCTSADVKITCTWSRISSLPDETVMCCPATVTNCAVSATVRLPPETTTGLEASCTWKRDWSANVTRPPPTVRCVRKRSTIEPPLTARSPSVMTSVSSVNEA